ncbi:MAG: GntR family transcriptional regulator [Deltaproteobacteria bacterium]|nr:MAG: GntR family transcriptional regulator [Deltaproteobacteria bacterium]
MSKGRNVTIGESMLTRARSGNQLLREQVYDYLQELMRTGTLVPGQAMSVSNMVKELGISRTPLREALLLLQEQGFVTILPQRGVVVNVLDIQDIKNIYEILGGIESRVLLVVFDGIGPEQFLRFEACNREMEQYLEGDILRHNLANIEFHDVFLSLSDNARMKKYVRNLKMQLYDFPRRDYGRKWNRKNLDEHNNFLELVRQGRAEDAASYLRDVHWAFDPADFLAAVSL